MHSDTARCTRSGLGSQSSTVTVPAQAALATSVRECRVVSRGKLSAVASDYGALEVLGGASIGATDPYVVMSAVDRMLDQLRA